MNKKVAALVVNKNGYTLIEMVVVLMILTVVTNLAIVSLVPINREHKAKNFLELLETDLLYAQQFAMSHGSNTTFLIDNSQRNYAIRHQMTNVMSRPFDEGILFTKGTLNLYDVVFLQNGNIRKAGTILVSIDQQEYRIVFLLGKGRFYIEKL